ncbi:MAG: tetratricopeptide repeat protein [Terriglobia bacterium]
MRWIVGTTLVLILVLHTGGPLVCAQKQQARPADVEPVRSYVSPSALKSVEIGDYYLRRKKLNAALSRFQEALKTDPHYAPAYRELGKVYEGMGHPQKALEAYRKYLDELPSAQAVREAKRTHKAIARLEKQLPSGGKSSGSQSTRQ